MSLFVQTNVASLQAQEDFGKTEVALNKTMEQLSSGYKINNAGDDAAGIGMASRLTAQVASYTSASQNANDALSMTQTADGGAAQIGDILTRMRQLAVEGANGTVSAADATNLNTEFSAQLNEINQIANTTTYNGISLLSGAAANTTFQVGINPTASDSLTVSFGGADNTASGLNLSAATVATTGGATAAITSIDAAIQTLSTVRAGFGAAMDGLQDIVSNIGSMSTNTSAALSQVQDVDVASATAQLAQQQVLSQAGESVLSQANQTPQLAESLIRGQ
jgi:flagellin